MTAYMTAEDARNRGVVLEVNRQLLHPRGLALQGEIVIDQPAEQIHTITMRKDGLEKFRGLVVWAQKQEALAWPAEWFVDLLGRIDESIAQPDAAVFRIRTTSDPEGFCFGDLDAEDARKAIRFDFMQRGMRARALGFDIEPLPKKQVASARLTADPSDPNLGHGSDDAPIPQHDVYLVLSDEELRKGFVRPVRRRYFHIGCGGITRMGEAIAETYARDPHFYGATYCCKCRMHKAVGEAGEFVWCEDSGFVIQPHVKVGT